MADMEIKNIVGKKIERYKQRLKNKELQMEVLLDFVHSINHDSSTVSILDKFMVFAREHFRIEKLVLFSKFSNWRCLVEYGLVSGELDRIDVERDLLHHKEITSVTTLQSESLKDFDLVVPVFHGETALAYLVLGDVREEEEEGMSSIVKNLNFLQILTNVIVSAIENQRLASQLLKEEQSKRKIIENQKQMLEELVEMRTRELRIEKEESERLLNNILPKKVAEELKEKGFTLPLRFNNATILFTDFKEFTRASSEISPKVLVGELNDVFRGFDLIVEKHGLEKIKTIGDSYMAAAGLPKKSRSHAVNVVRACMEMLAFLETRKKKARIKWEMRVGVNSGPLVAGVVGVKKFTYDIWGDTVNIASRMESNSQVGRINISRYTEVMIRPYFECEYRGKLAAKGKGEIDMYFVTGEKMSQRLEQLKGIVTDLLSNKLPSNLSYHNLSHTLNVFDASYTIALGENMSVKNIELIRTAALLHDTGFTVQNQGHEEKSCEIAKEMLPPLGYKPREIQTICGMIMATKVPQQPQNRMEEILCDADLDTLGRSDYEVHARNLLKELNAYRPSNDQLNEKHWQDYQVKFLSQHRYFTQTSQDLREDEKIKQLKRIKDLKA